jgi:4-oxalocrotonate tautomerase
VPVIEVKMVDRRLTEDTAERVISAMTEALCDALQEDVRESTWVVVTGVPADQWGIAGKPLD